MDLVRFAISSAETFMRSFESWIYSSSVWESSYKLREGAPLPTL